MQNDTTKGRLIVIEGIDGAGKTTHAEILARRLEDDEALEVVRIKQPSTGPIGVMLRAMLAGDVAKPSERVLELLFAADRADQAETVVKPAIKRGAIVVSDRYYHSSIAYQTAGLPLDDVGKAVARIIDLNHVAVVPTRTIILAPSVDLAVQRLAGRPRRDAYENAAWLTEVDRRYRTMDYLTRRTGDTIRYVDIDACDSQDTTHEEIWTVVQAALS